MAYLSNQVTPGVFNVWSALDRDLHRQKRKLIGPAVNDRSMRAFEPTMTEQVDILIRLVAQSQGRPIDMSWRCNYLGMDVVSLLSFGFALNSQTHEQYRFLSDKMAPNNRRLNAVMQVPSIARYRLQVPINMIWQRSRQPVFDLLELMIKRRTGQPQDAHHDLWSFIADSMKTDEGKDLQARDLWMEAIFFIVAGMHTFLLHTWLLLFSLTLPPPLFNLLVPYLASTPLHADFFQEATQRQRAWPPRCSTLRGTGTVITS